MKKYRPTDTETKWQDRWSKQNLYQTDLSQPNNKYYVLVELAYTSGDLHMGHWFTFTHGDIIARFKRMLGHNVVFPNGFDAFGLPAENAAIKRNIHPSDWTYDNVLRMRAQFDTLGSSIDWTKTIVACDPQYYKWNQWMFLRMLEKGLAYRGKLLSNWCPSCETVLANENVEVGKCWRCGTKVIQKAIEQWFFRITDYADRLIWQNPPQSDWPKSLTEGQNKWIGKSEGVLLKFQIDSKSANNGFIEVFTTRPDTIFGTTFIVISPEHPLIPEIITSKQRKIVTSYINQSKTKTELERNQNKDKTGVFTGAYVNNPLSGEATPVWVADYVLTGYGTGAVMGVPAHDSRDFEFAKKFDLPVKPVIQPEGVKQSRPLTEVFEDEGVVVASGQFTGMKSAEARETISRYIVDNKYGSYKTQYHLHDWSISRQRYWGTPIPIIYCDNCGVVPVPDKDLPVELPYKVDYAPKGQAPLATAEGWVKVKCPKCRGDGRREVETMDTFVDSSWYFFRYLDPSNQAEIFDKQIIKNWMPVDIYIGGAEHTLGHALYSRFFTMVFHDLGLISFDEYANRRIHHGTILGTDGSKMSKSRGNIINPDEQVKEYGADAVRTYLAFLGPYDIVAAWNPSGVNAVYHFIERVWNLYEGLAVNQDKLSAQDLQIMHKTIKKVTNDIENIKFNTAVAAMMEWLNHLSRKSHDRQLSKAEYLVLLKLLCPFAPHITEELWEIIGQPFSIHQQSWPEFDEAFLQLDEISIVVQVNGKVRDNIVISKEILNDSKKIEKMVKNSQKVQKYLDGNQIKKSIYIPGKIINLVI